MSIIARFAKDNRHVLSGFPKYQWVGLYCGVQQQNVLLNSKKKSLTPYHHRDLHYRNAFCSNSSSSSSHTFNATHFPIQFVHTCPNYLKNAGVSGKDTEDSSVTSFDRPNFKYLDTTFNDAHEAYRSKTNKELIRALFVFRMTSFETLVNNNEKILKLARKLMGKSLFNSFMRGTFYGQFVAGADVEEIRTVLEKNHKYGVKSILDYSVEDDMPEEQAKEKTLKAYAPLQEGASGEETTPAAGQYGYHEQYGDRRKHVMSARTYFYDSEGQCDKNMWTFMKCVDVVSEATNGTGLAAIKLTALGRPKFLLQMSHALTSMKDVFDLLTSEEADVVLKRIKTETLESQFAEKGVPGLRDETKQWFTWLDITDGKEIDLYSWTNLVGSDGSLGQLFGIPSLKDGVLEQKFSSIPSDQEAELRNMFKRINKIIEHAAERDVRVMVDAEQTYFQPAISRLTMEMMRKFNKEKPIVFNTYQCYLKEAYSNFLIDLDLARREGFTFGCKIVRGAYMDQERQRAADIGYPDPINENFEASSAMYEKVIDAVLKEAVARGQGQVAAMAATHNEETIRYCVQRLKDYGLRREDKALCFGQLLGMCDHITFPLGQSGYSVYKYVPYGPVEEVLPYLTRRAAENRGILAKVQKEKRLLRAEIGRRINPFSSKS